MRKIVLLLVLLPFMILSAPNKLEQMKIEAVIHLDQLLKESAATPWKNVWKKLYQNSSGKTIVPENLINIKTAGIIFKDKKTLVISDGADFTDFLTSYDMKPFKKEGTKKFYHSRTNSRHQAMIDQKLFLAGSNELVENAQKLPLKKLLPPTPAVAKGAKLISYLKVELPEDPFSDLKKLPQQLKPMLATLTTVEMISLIQNNKGISRLTLTLTPKMAKAAEQVVKMFHQQYQSKVTQMLTNPDQMKRTKKRLLKRFTPEEAELFLTVPKMGLDLYNNMKFSVVNNQLIIETSGPVETAAFPVLISTGFFTALVYMRPADHPRRVKYPRSEKIKMKSAAPKK